MSELRYCIDVANKVFNYCLRWPQVVGKYKDKLEEIESELVNNGQNYSMLLDKKGDVKEKVYDLQIEHATVHATKNSLIDAFQKVKDITKGRLEQMIETLKLGEEMEVAITIPESLV